MQNNPTGAPATAAAEPCPELAAARAENESLRRQLDEARAALATSQREASATAAVAASAAASAAPTSDLEATLGFYELMTGTSPRGRHRRLRSIHGHSSPLMATRAPSAAEKHSWPLITTHGHEGAIGG